MEERKEPISAKKRVTKSEKVFNQKKSRKEEFLDPQILELRISEKSNESISILESRVQSADEDDRSSNNIV